MIAPGRRARPGATIAAPAPATEHELRLCPLCEGKEGETPPETLALGGDPGRVPDTPGWLVRVVPNKYPAFEPQEVVVHAPNHARSLGELDPAQLQLVAEAWRLRAAGSGRAGGYLHPLVNEGAAAGASLSHSHSQLVWLAERPPLVLEELELWAGGCGVCEELSTGGDRVVDERDGAVLLCPYASRTPYELLVAPAEHAGAGLCDERLGAALELAADGLRALGRVEGRVAATLWLHHERHWHLEVLPRLAVPGGIELGSGIYVNAVAPENAAEALRASV